MATRWGICSAGGISTDYAAAICTLSPEEHKAIAVAARSLERAEEFAKLYNIPQAYGSYEELANDANVDVVYIGAINTEHFRLCKMMLNADKNVVCEKPLMMNLKQTKDIIALAKEKKKFFMEGLWSRFFPVTKKLMKEIEDNTIGDVKYVEGSHCAPIGDVERLAKRELGGGGLVDIGIYPIQFVCQIFKEMPKKIIAVGHLNDDGVDVSTSTTLVYSDGRMAHVTSHTQTQFYTSAVVLGTKGKLEIESNCWNATKLITPSGTHEIPHPEVKLKHKFGNAGGFTYQIQCVRECLNKGHLECPLATHEDSIMIATIMEEIRHQIGVVYDADKE